MGRAARNVNGKVILYADTITKSMQEAISEVNRRRDKQRKYNIENGINPKSIVREISDDLLNLDYGLDVVDRGVAEIKKVYMSRKDVEVEVLKLEKEIKVLAAELDFEKAIEKRNEMLKLKELLLEI
jgi:excinuclease ABC subunit B